MPWRWRCGISEGISDPHVAGGDSLISNDPWLTSGHLNDFTVVTPIFRRGDLVALFANACHAMDVGGRTLGADAREVFEEGLYVPMLKLFERGQPNRDLFKLIKQNMRTPELVEGDLMAQVGGNEVGGAKLIEFMEEYYMTSLADLSKPSSLPRKRPCARPSTRFQTAHTSTKFSSTASMKPIKVPLRSPLAAPNSALISLGPPPDRSRHQRALRPEMYHLSSPPQ